MIEATYLAGKSPEAIGSVLHGFLSRPVDARYLAETAAAKAIAMHVTTACRGLCLSGLTDLERADESGAEGTTLVGRVQFGLLELAHPRPANVRRAWGAAHRALQAGLAPKLRWWLRAYAPHVRSAIRMHDGARLIAQLAATDPEGWRGALVETLRYASGSDRELILGAIPRHANRETIEAMKEIEGRDIAETRRQLQHAQAARLFLRTFGGVSLHRGDWAGPALPIEKKRVRMLLAVLAARAHTTLTRDMALDILWPNTDADGAINNLNQTVFQLRRYIDPTYRGGESPEYVISTSDQVGLNPDLVHTDLEEIRRLSAKTASVDWGQRQLAARRAINLVRGEFLADLRYEEWTSVQQMAVHNEVRDQLLPIALTPSTAYDLEVSVLAASALIALDPYDEAAVLALAECLSRSGRRVAARDLVVDYAKRVQVELDDEPSPEVVQAAQGFGARGQIKPDLTKIAAN
jgi:DNA-binding SARP family transcriptional activator